MSFLTIRRVALAVRNRVDLRPDQQRRRQHAQGSAMQSRPGAGDQASAGTRYTVIETGVIHDRRPKTPDRTGSREAVSCHQGQPQRDPRPLLTALDVPAWLA